MHQFDEWHPRFAGLSALYENEIRGGLAGRDPARRKALAFSAVTLILLLPPAALLYFGSVWLSGRFGFPPDVFQVLGMVAGGGALFLVMRRMAKVKFELKTFLMEPICAHLDLSFSPEASSEPIRHFKAMHLIPVYDRAKTEDEISGQHEDVPFFLLEAVLTRGTGKNRRRVFRGLLFYFAFPKPFRGRTILTRDKGWLGNVFEKLGKPGERIHLEDPRFEDVFEVYGSDQVEARYLLTPSFMERLVDLAGDIGRSGLQLAFDDNKLMIALPRDENQFEAGSLLSALENPERVQRIVDQIGWIFRIIETLNLSLKTRA